MEVLPREKTSSKYTECPFGHRVKFKPAILTYTALNQLISQDASEDRLALLSDVNHFTYSHNLHAHQNSPGLRLCNILPLYGRPFCLV